MYFFILLLFYFNFTRHTIQIFEITIVLKPTNRWRRTGKFGKYEFKSRNQVMPKGKTNITMHITVFHSVLKISDNLQTVDLLNRNVSQTQTK